MKDKDWKLIQFTAIENPGAAEEYERPYRCYSCGNTKGFSTEYNSWTYEYETICHECGSEDTNWDGEGYIYCDKCNKHMYWNELCEECERMFCKECWEYYPIANKCPVCGLEVDYNEDKETKD